MDYKTFLPGSLLSPFVKCFWSLEAPPSPSVEKQIIVPDGCMEMIIHYGDPYIQFLTNEKTIVQPRSFVFGQITSPLVIAPTGSSGIVATRFLPDGFVPFSSFATNAMTNRAVPLQELFGTEGTKLEKNVVAAVTTEERITIMEYFLTRRLSTAESTNTLAKETFNLLMHSKGQISVEALVTRLNTSPRQLERKLSSVIGLSPKQLSKIIRLQSTLKLMEKQQFTSLTELAHECGYFDQAHFIKDFKEFTGVSPKQFYADHMKMSVLFIGAD